MERLWAKTGPEHLKIIPIGDSDVEGDFWVIPFQELRGLLVPEDLTKGRAKNDVPRIPRWRFHIENHRFVLYPGSRVRLGEIDVRRFYGAPLPRFAACGL